MSDLPNTPLAVSDAKLPADAARRVRVSDWFAEDHHGTHIVDGFSAYAVDLGFSVRTDAAARAHRDLALSLWHAIDDLNNVGVLLHRMNWMHAQASQGTIEEGIACMYLALDVELFHVEVRSALDYCSRAIAAAAAQPGQVPGDSLRKLRAWLRREPSRGTRLLGQDLVDLTLGATWFPEMRGVRDAMVHKGGRVTVFPYVETILFQVHDESWKNLVAVEHIMHNENVVDFRPYAAIHFAELLLFVDGVVQVLRRRVPMRRPGGGQGVRSYNLGYPTFLSWLSAYGDAVRRSLEGA